MTSEPEASIGAPVPPLSAVALVPRLRGVVLVTATVASLAALGVVALQLVPWAAPGSVQRALGPAAGERAWLTLRAGGSPGLLGPTGVLVGLLGVLVGTMAVLSALRLVEARAGEIRRARYREWARQRQASERAEPAPTTRVEPGHGGVEAILVVDLVQSTELMAQHGDEFFRNLLRRVGATFVPVARALGTRCVEGHGDGFLFCFERVEQALEAFQGMFARLPEINRDNPAGVEVAFRGSLHVGETAADVRGNRMGVAVVKAVRLGSVMENLHGRGGGRNSLVVSEEVLPALAAAGIVTTPLGEVALRGLPGTHAVYEARI